MDIDQNAQVLALVSAERQEPGDQPAAAGWLQRVCRAAARDLPATGVGISLLSPEGDVVRAVASSPDSLRVEELQLTMGEGPCLLAYANRTPVLVPDLTSEARSTWPGYAPAAYELGVRAVFAFPLLVGDARLGALDVYRDRTGRLAPAAHDRAAVFAEVTMEQLLQVGATEAGAESLLESADGTRFEVYQAQGMVMVQLSIGAEDAMARLRAQAFLHDRTLIEVAQDVIARKITLQRDAR